MLRRLFAAIAAVVLAALTLTTPALAQDDEPNDIGLLGTTDTLIVVDPASSSIEVVQTYRFVNTTEAEAFTGFFETLPEDAVDVEASVNGASVVALSLPAGDGFAEWLISFPEPLEPGGTAVEASITWRRTGLNGNPNDFDQVSSGIVAIAPFAAGHNETEARLRIQVPGSYDVVLADDYDVVLVDDGMEFEVQAPTSGQYVPLPLVLEASDRFARLAVDGPIDLTLATPDGRTDWLAEDLSDLVIDLDGWIPLARPDALEFRQGYTGGADLRRADDGVFVLPFDASPAVALRAVAAAWLEPLSFSDPGLRDDLAAALADRVAVAQGVAVPPRASEWSTAVTALVAVSDAGSASTVLTALDGGIPAYGGADDTFAAEVIDWRRFTDVYEHIGGVQSAGDAMRLSATPDQTAELELRAAALGDYRALEARAAPWSMPPVVREAMAQWRFADFAAMQASVSDLIAARDEMVAASAAVDLDIGDHLQELFESAEVSMDPAWELYVEQRESLDPVAEALRLDTGDRGLLSSLGMAGRDASAQLAQIHTLWAIGEFDDSAEAAEHLVEDYESSVGRGTLRLLGPLLALAVVLGLVQRWRRPKRDAQLAESP